MPAGEHEPTVSHILPFGGELVPCQEQDVAWRRACFRGRHRLRRCRIVSRRNCDPRVFGNLFPVYREFFPEGFSREARRHKRCCMLYRACRRRRLEKPLRSLRRSPYKFRGETLLKPNRCLCNLLYTLRGVMPRRRAAFD